MTDPMPLDQAVALCFPYGGVTKATLLAAIADGALEFERIGRRYFVTADQIAKWREKSCRGVPKARGSKSTGEKAGRTSTISVTERGAIARSALQAMLKGQDSHSGDTWKRTTGQTPGNVTSLKSR